MRPSLLFAAACAAVLLAVPLHGDDAVFSGPARLRGFNVSRLAPDVLDDAKNVWHVNAVRLQFNVGLIKKRDHLTLDQAWDKILADLPAGLDAAAARGLTVILAIPQDGLVEAVPALDVAGNQGRFWTEEVGYAALSARWRQLVAICGPRRQPIWYDLLNEPLNRAEKPLNFPSAWPGWAQRLIDQIRQDDPHHPITIEPGPGGLCWGFKTFPALKGEHLTYSVHSYQPQAYTHQGIADVQHTDLAQAYLQRQRPWPGDYPEDGGGQWDHARLVKELEPVSLFQQRNPGARIYVGEFSVVRWAPNGAQYLRETIDFFESRGWDWTYHAFREFNGWSLELDNTYGTAEQAKPAVGLTDRGQVVKEYLDRNLADRNPAPAAPKAP